MKRQVRTLLLLSAVVFLVLAGCIALAVYMLITGDNVFAAIFELVVIGLLLLFFPFLIWDNLLGIRFRGAVERGDLAGAARIVTRCERLHRFLPFFGAEDKRIALYAASDEIPALKEAIAAYRSARSERVGRMRTLETAYLCAMVALDEGRIVDARAEYDLFLTFYLENTKRRSDGGAAQAMANKKNYALQAEMLQAVFTRLDGGYAVRPQYETVYPVVKRVLRRVFPQ